MKTLNLIHPDNSDLPYKALIFPDGQPHLKLDLGSLAGIDRSEPFRILARAASATDLLQILFAKNTLDYLEFAHVELHLAYLLAARMAGNSRRRAIFSKGDRHNAEHGRI